MSEILAFDLGIKNNAQLIEQVAQLNYLNHDMSVLDTTYGLGNFWTKWEPKNLIGLDINADKAKDVQGSFLNLPFADATFDAVIFDPPYRLNGSERIYTQQDRYGVAEKQDWKMRLHYMYVGALECLRVTKHNGYLLVKCQDQVVNNNVVWQTKLIANLLSEQARLVDELYLEGYRKQPPGRRQVHARRNYSTMQVYQRNKEEEYNG